MKDPTDSFIRRAQNYWFTDGLTEIGFAVLCLVLSLYFYGQATLTPGSIFYRILDVGFLLILLVSGIVIRRVITNFKARLIYPRTGYVSYHPPKRIQTIGTVILAFILSSMLVVLFSSSEISPAYMPAASGILIGGALTFTAYRYGLLRFYLLAAISAILGTWLSFSGAGDMYGLSLYYGFMGLALLIMGLLILRDYLIKSEPSELVGDSQERDHGKHG
jgi:hypothetical protein